MMWNDGHWGAGSWLAMSLIMVVFWVGLVVLIVWVVRYARSDASRPTGQVPDGSRRADEILADRFARGEIDEDEFRRRRDLLHSPPTVR